ncbi:MAG: hypothetical protein ACR2P1_23190 [Pseudomonadales bacterium]
MIRHFPLNAIPSPSPVARSKEGNPVTDIPMLLDYYRQGKLDLDSMVTQTYTIDQVHHAIADMEKNVNARSVIVFD